MYVGNVDHRRAGAGRDSRSCVGAAIVEHEQLVDEGDAVDERMAHHADQGADGGRFVAAGDAYRDRAALLGLDQQIHGAVVDLEGAYGAHFTPLVESEGR